MAATMFADLTQLTSGDDEMIAREEDLALPTEAYRFVHSETTEQLDNRKGELYDLLDESLAVAISELRSRIRV